MPDDLGVAAPQNAVHLVAELRVRLCACVRVEKVLCTPLFLLRGGCGDSTLILQLGDCDLKVDISAKCLSGNNSGSKVSV